MKLSGSSKKIIDKDEDEELVSRLDYVDVVLMHCSFNAVTIIKKHLKF